LYEIADRLELEAAPRLLRSDDVKMPFAAGLLSSTIVLPAESDGWSAERRSAVLIHELGHVRRRDLIGHTMSRIACTLYWFHPLVWTAARRLRAESERACDDLALVFGARPSDYAEHLLDIVTCVRDHNTPAVALAMAHRREFEGRMLAILNPELRRRGPGRVQTVSMVGSLALVALLIGAASPAPRRSSPSATPPGESTTGQLLADRTMQEPVAAPAVPTTVRPIQKPAPNPRPDPRPNPLADPQPPADLSSAEQPDDERAAVLAKTLRTDSNAGVRRVAAWGLRRYAQMDVALEALVGALGNDADASVREMSAWALQGARRNSTASAAIAKAIRQDKNAEVRATAVWAAGSIGDGSAVDALVGVLGDAEAEVREMAAWSIGACSPDHAPAALLRALTDKERDVRLSAAWALYQIRDPETVSAIDAAFQHESDGEVREGLIRALGQMGDRAVDALQRLVTSPDSTIRTVAVTALAGGNATGPWPWPRPQPRPYP
jgi:HEAT repeat protein